MAVQSFQVKVSVRERPLLQSQDRGDEVRQIWPGHYLSPEISQEDAAAGIGIYDLADSFLRGMNCTVLAYGQTGSGKTHTMLGPPGALAAPQGTQRSLGEWGVWPRAMSHLLDRLATLPDAQLRTWAVEVYMDNVFDLLNQKAPVRISSGRSSSSGFTYQQNSQAQYDSQGKWIPPIFNGKVNPTLKSTVDAVAGQQAEIINSLEDVIRVGQTVEATRAAQSHALNCRSSRSHAIIGVVLTMAGKTSRWYFVDLAGSERVKKSEVDGLRMAEAVATNKSLSALQRVIESLSTGSRCIPYRDHMLTNMLSQSLGRSSRTAVIVTVSGSSTNMEETKSSVRFARTYLRVTSHVEEARSTDPAAISKVLQRAEEQLSVLAQTSHAGGVNPGASSCEKKAWSHNLEQLKRYRQQVVEHKKALQGNLSESRKQRLKKDLSFANAKVTLHEGVVARMMLSGLFKNPSPLLVSKQREVQQLRQCLGDASREANIGSALPGGEVVLGMGLGGMIRQITASHEQGQLPRIGEIQ
eukprot:TRINITY_DN45676_c0_g1_i1.p1 TRINITY_DN45676_c0_g1~~TRINITY_DN45676_c0_g1_i1.p1  ORF type:complete len:525 (+),score=80.18 TRINITY_DN45676_c0_g1_i1:44-1618(+)